jgi:hypothetical protein
MDLDYRALSNGALLRGPMTRTEIRRAREWCATLDGADGVKSESGAGRGAISWSEN